MPKYDYRCGACGKVYEKREGFDAPPVQQCPTCDGVARRVLTPPAIVFKGSGWYVNDSRKSSAGSSDSAAASTSSETKTETKTETKVESKSDSAPSTTSSPAAAAAD